MISALTAPGTHAQEPGVPLFGARGPSCAPFPSTAAAPKPSAAALFRSAVPPCAAPRIARSPPRLTAWARTSARPSVTPLASARPARAPHPLPGRPHWQVLLPRAALAAQRPRRPPEILADFLPKPDPEIPGPAPFNHRAAPPGSLICSRLPQTLARRSAAAPPCRTSAPTWPRRSAAAPPLQLPAFVPPRRADAHRSFCPRIRPTAAGNSAENHRR